MLKIEAGTATETEALYLLTGRVDTEHLDELKAVLSREAAAGKRVIFDLEGVVEVDREAVRFFVKGTGRAAHLRHCPAYVKEWCRVEAGRRTASKRGKAGMALFAILLTAATARAQSQAPPVSLTVREAVGRALSEGTAARLASERVTQSRAEAVRAQSGLLPRIDTEVQDYNQILNLKTFGFSLPGLPGTVGPFNVFDAHLRVASRIVDVAAYRRWRAARQGTVVSDVDRLTTENEVAAAVATLYVSLQRAEASIEAIRANVGLSQKLFELADDQRKAGVATRLDSTRAAVTLARQRQLLLVAQNRADAARLALLRAIGMDMATPVVLADSLKDEPAEIPTAEAAWSVARNRRPELRASSERLRQAELTVSADRAERLPSIGAQFQGGYNGNHLRDLDWNRTIGATLTIPIFTGGQTAARIAEDDSKRREVLIQERDVERQVEEDVRQAVLSYQSARTRVGVSEEGERLARQELEFARDRFTNGITSSIEVDNAQTSLITAQDDRISALADESQARYDLARATGAIRDVIPVGDSVSVTAPDLPKQQK